MGGLSRPLGGRALLALSPEHVYNSVGSSGGSSGYVSALGGYLRNWRLRTRKIFPRPGCISALSGHFAVTRVISSQSGFAPHSECAPLLEEVPRVSGLSVCLLVVVVAWALRFFLPQGSQGVMLSSLVPRTRGPSRG